jgi:hypothetical protein
MTTVTTDIRMRWWAVAWFVAGVIASGCGASRPALQPSGPLAARGWTGVTAFEVFAQHIFSRARIGGVSGLARDESTGDWIAVSDSRLRPMWFTVRIVLGSGQSGVGSPGRVDVGIDRGIRARPPVAGQEWLPDYEAIVTLPNGQLLIASEGDLVEHVRFPASIWRYERDGRFVSSLPLPEKFLPARDGDSPRGLRDNHGFEGMAIDPQASRLWAISEAPLLQDDDVAGLERGGRARIIEWSVADDALHIVRELVYPIDAVGNAVRVPAGAEVFDQGVSDLTVLPSGVLVSMERAFVQHKASGWSTNVIRLFRLDLDEADDVSASGSLRDVPGARPVRKQLIADLSTFAPHLDPRLASLENFEAIAPGPPTPDGRPTLLVMSDDNFSLRQVTALLVLAAR